MFIDCQISITGVANDKIGRFLYLLPMLLLRSIVIPLKRVRAANKLVAIAPLTVILAIAPVSAFEVRPDKNLTGGSVRTGDRDAACGHAKEHRGPMFSARRDEILKRYRLPPGTHPDYEIDHLIPLCLGGSDDPSNLWPQPRRA